MIKQIPNAITSANLLCGVIAIIHIFQGDYITASYLVFTAGVLDFFDGFTARLLQVGGELGKQLDSLADVVTFGVTPALLLLQLSTTIQQNEGTYNSLAYLNYLSLGIAVFSALRLAKFNIDTRQSDQFIGLPTPANAYLIAAFPFIALDFPEIALPFLKNSWVIGLFSIVSCFLLVAEIPLFSLKFKQYRFKGNEIRYVFLLLSLVILVFFHFAGIAGIILLYIILSIIQHFIFTTHEIHR